MNAENAHFVINTSVWWSVPDLLVLRCRGIDVRYVSCSGPCGVSVWTNHCHKVSIRIKSIRWQVQTLSQGCIDLQLTFDLRGVVFYNRSNAKYSQACAIMNVIIPCIDPENFSKGGSDCHLSLPGGGGVPRYIIGNLNMSNSKKFEFSRGLGGLYLPDERMILPQPFSQHL